MVRNIKKLFYNPESFALFLLSKFGGFISDRLYLKLMFRFRMGKSLNLKNPQTFNEKLQWLKLYDRNPIYTTMVDKYAVKSYVAKSIGEQYIIPTLGVWNSFDEIEFDKLPDRFVLKCTHDSGGLVICKDKSRLDFENARIKINNSLKNNYFMHGREWPYKNVPKRIIAEQYIEPDKTAKDLRDYKFFCFNGIPIYCQVIGGRENVMTVDFFDKNWNHQPFHEPKEYPFSEIDIEKPLNLELMWSLAEKLADSKPFSRIDFYEVNGKVYFGEITFFPTTGMGMFDPEEWSKKFGNMIMLPKDL